ncbi:MAG: hypothetical protein NZ518_02180 [Dehalococcoidia bacterium]|nr:hypothetical protein [Dehalococcoidia bacterium]
MTLTLRASLLALAMAIAQAHAATVADVSTLLERARVEGRAYGVLGGEAAERMRAMGIDKPVEVTVTRLYHLKDPECARLRAAFDQRGVVLPGETTPKDRHNAFEINWCPGGRPPTTTEPADGETLLARREDAMAKSSPEQAGPSAQASVQPIAARPARSPGAQPADVGKAKTQRRKRSGP